MRFDNRLFGFLLLASVSVWGLAGCGSDIECGDGTVKEDGSCVPEVTCGPGTQADEESGECVVGGDGCAAGTTFDSESGTCVVSGDDACDTGTKFDEDTNSCVAVISECGENTEMNDDGVCMPKLDELCASMGAVKAENGKCVVGEAACSEGTKLSANGNCVVAQEGCGAGLALNDDGKCEATDEVCGDKTTFQPDMGLCLPDQTCQMGDVVADGVCVSPAENLAANADVEESENNHADTGGTPNDLTVKNVGETTVFTGTIEAPRSIDGSGAKKQDIDSFKFDGSAGDWFKISVQSLGLPQPILIVSGPDGYVRFSPSARPSLTETEMRRDDAGRKLVLPRDGEYTVSVMPTPQALDGSIDPAGASDWKYVGALEKVDASSASSHDLSMNPLTGDAGLPDNNFYEVSGFQSADLVQFTVDKQGEDVEGVLQVWKDPSTLAASVELDSNDPALVPLPQLSNDTFHAVVDWKTMSGDDVGYEISADTLGNTEGLGMISPDMEATSSKTSVKQGEQYFYTFSVQPGQVIEIINENAEDEEIGYTLFDNSATELRSESDMEVPSDRSSSFGADDGYYYTESGGDFVLRITAEDDDHTDQTITVKSHTPDDFGLLKAGDSLSKKVDGGGSVVGPEARSDFYVVEFTENVTLDGTLAPLDPSDGEVEFYAYNPGDYSELYDFDDDDGPISIDRSLVEAGKYVWRVQFEQDIKSYELTAQLSPAPIVEQEPNDSQADASPLELGKDFLMSLDDNDTDWFKFDVSQDMAANESVFFQLGNSSSDSDDYACELMDSNGQTLFKVEDRDFGCSLFGAGLSKGTYFIKIDFTDSTPQDYGDLSTQLSVIEAAGESEPNNTPMNANSPMLLKNGNRLAVAGQVTEQDLEDVFEFQMPGTIPSGAELHLGLSMVGPDHAEDTKWELLDASGSKVASDDYDKTHTISSPSAGATYTVKVIGDSGDVDDEDGEYVVQAGLLNPDQTVSSSPGADFQDSAKTDSVSVSNCGTVDDVSVDVDVDADGRGEFAMELTSPNGDTARFWKSYEYGDENTDHVVGNFPVTQFPWADMSVFDGKSGNGDWELTVIPVNTSSFSFYTYELKSWSLNVDCQ